ncbi:two-component sensor histidine kinase [Paenibacillus sp. MY03]|jgi:two-component system sensor histidine kinase YesM|uniref:sensor histidine kinase n=1 Tax=Paenibacillus sp. MY03 TaxID=302980 RepID=UPI000B3C1D65|nr:sensor histidine kinase [Paenibacillus sp. MY03]OUS78649.1 two-component sensor histidine kinase [Paenibacillus sp. MY03]
MFIEFVRRLANRTNDIRIKPKLIVSFILVVFVPVLIVGVFLTLAFRQNVLDQATQQVGSNVDRVKSQIANIVRMPLEVSDNLLSDARLMNVVNTQYASTYSVVEAYREYRDIRDSVKLYNEIHNIRFYYTNPTMLDNWEFLRITPEKTREPWFHQAMTEDGIRWQYVEDETKGNQKYLSLVRKVNFPLYRTSGVLVITIDPEVLGSMMRQEAFDTMIIEDNGYIVAAKDGALVGKNINDATFNSPIAGKSEGTYEFRYDGKPSRVVIEKLIPTSSRNGLRVVSVFAVDSIVGGANRISLLGLAIMLVSLAVAWGLIYLTSTLISKRMLLLHKDLNKVAMGDLNVISSVSGNDEIGMLSRQFNNMVVSIRGLMDEVADSESQKAQLLLRQREIKLKMMASQINPHFLFNALESIRMKAHMNGQKEISVVVRMLGKMIRQNLEVGNRRIAIRDEIEVVRCYLEIQKFRYGGDRLSFLLDVDESCASVELPPLVIQPLVENAVVHGLDHVEQGGFVSVRVYRNEEGVGIEIKDNGSGIDEERMGSILRSFDDMEEEEQYRIGLRNVHQRLIMIYGESFGLRIESVLGEGTFITFNIPTGGLRHA